MGKHKKKAKAKNTAASRSMDEDERANPHTIIFSRPEAGVYLRRLANDLRLAFEPYTALNFKFQKSNVLKDVLSIAGHFAVSHLLYFTHPENSVNMRLVTCPHGPTLVFRLQSYTLKGDVLSSLKKFNMNPTQFHHAPLLIMNGFSGDGQHLKLLTTSFRSLLPALNLQKLQLKTVRRCILLNYIPETETIQFRHYNIRIVPRGLSKAMRRTRRKKVPDLGRYRDISEFMQKAGYASDSGLSEADFDGEHNTIDCLPSELSALNPGGSSSAVRLSEIGPRLDLQLIKVEENVNSGQVLYHRFINKTEEEEAELASRLRKKKRLKAQRKSRQEDRVAQKTAEKLAHKRRCLEGMVSAGQITAEQADTILKTDGNVPSEEADEGADTASKRKPSTLDEELTVPRKKPKFSVSLKSKLSSKTGAKKSLRFMRKKKP